MKSCICFWLLRYYSSSVLFFISSSQILKCLFFLSLIVPFLVTFVSLITGYSFWQFWTSSTISFTFHANMFLALNCVCGSKLLFRHLFTFLQFLINELNYLDASKMLGARPHNRVSRRSNFYNEYDKGDNSNNIIFSILYYHNYQFTS